MREEIALGAQQATAAKTTPETDSAEAADRKRRERLKDLDVSDRDGGVVKGGIPEEPDSPPTTSRHVLSANAETTSTSGAAGTAGDGPDFVVVLPPLFSADECDRIVRSSARWVDPREHRVEGWKRRRRRSRRAPRPSNPVQTLTGNAMGLRSPDARPRVVQCGALPVRRSRPRRPFDC